jgi:PII-like signaling protein
VKARQHEGTIAMKEQFQARMLRIHFGENDKWQGKPLYEAIVAKAQELGLADAIVYRGIEGFGSSTRIHHSSHWTFSSDAPIMVSIIDSEEQIARLVPRLDAMVEEGLIAISSVEVLRYSRSSGHTSPKP